MKKMARNSHLSISMPSFHKAHPIITNSSYCAKAELPGEGLGKINRRKGSFLIRFFLKSHNCKAKNTIKEQQKKGCTI